MHVTLCSEVLREMDIGAQCDFAARLGYDGLEIAPFTLGDAPHRLPAATIARARRAAADSGIALTGLHWLLVAPEGLSITSGDESVRARTRDVIRGLVDLCAALGGRYLVHGSPAQRVLTPGAEVDDRARGVALIAEAAEMAGRAGVTYVLEPLSPDQTGFVTSVAEAAAIVAEIDSPALRTMVDCSAAGASEAESVPDLLRRWWPTGHLAHVHFNDPNRRGPGEGDLTFAPIVATLAELGYDGWVGVEPFVYCPDGPACAARAIGYIRGLEEKNR